MQPSAVVAVVFQDKKHVLVVTRYHPKLIAFPGGSIDRGERPEEAVVRELYEETGVIAEDVSPIYRGASKKDGHPFSKEKIVQAYYIPRWRGMPHQKEEGVEVRWVDWRDLCNPEKSPYITYAHRVFMAMGLLKK